MRRRFGIVKTVRDDKVVSFSVGVISYDRETGLTEHVTSDSTMLSIDSRDHLADEDAIIMRLKLMLRDCESNPVYVVKD